MPGDEFVAIVQELVGIRLKSCAAGSSQPFPSFHCRVRGSGQARVGISVGTATFGADGETLDQLLVAADQAMYRAKSSHKLDKLSLEQDLSRKISMETKPSAVVIELDTDNLATVAVN